MLKYPYNAFVPYISENTMKIHYNEHYLRYKKFVDDLNIVNLIDSINNIDKYEIQDRGKILFNIGGVLNHQLYFNSINIKNRKPSGLLEDEIIKTYGSYNDFLKQFIKKANELVGSGFTFLVLNQNKLDIINLSNQDNPYMYKMIPLLALYLWEHSYYLDYQNNRNYYINNFFQIVDFYEANKIFEENKL